MAQTIKKYVLDLTVKGVEHISDKHLLIRLTDGSPLPEMMPGQFVEVRIDGSPSTFLRRPISINFVDRENNELWLMVAMVGEGTRSLQALKAGDTLNCVLPLGTGFTMPEFLGNAKSFLLVGGGVGIAPLLYLGSVLKNNYSDIAVTFLLGGRSAKDLLLLSEFEKYGRVLVTTEDGTMGEKGFVTNHSILQQEHFDMIQCCGPTPMMKAVARYAYKSGTACEVSLENLMACGLGACLCCVEKTVEGNLCVCKEGPVFNVKRLLWQD